GNTIHTACTLLLYCTIVKLMLSDVKDRRPLADLRVSLKDLFFGRLHLEVLFMVMHDASIHLLSEDVVALLFGMHLVFSMLTPCVMMINPSVTPRVSALDEV
ncbi:hypothetical protein Tco_1428785, partial [Tanacetum coccineum]